MVTRKTPAVRIACSAAFLVLALALVPTALAGKPGGGGGKPTGGGTSGGGTISLAPLVYDANGDGLPNHGDTVMFNVSTTATTQPYVDLKCYQNGVLVAEGWRGYFAGSLDTPNFGLYAGPWMSGAADCTAYLDKTTSKGGMQQLASVSFHVYA
jgi:hypothetical protein